MSDVSKVLAIPSVLEEKLPLIISELSNSKSKELKELSNRIAKSILNTLRERGEGEPLIRASNIGRPLRYLYLLSKSPRVKEELTLKTYFKFIIGSVMEEVILWMIERTGDYVVRDRQKTIGPFKGVKGHLDVVINDVLLDVKTSSGNSFFKFFNNALFSEQGDSFGYLHQLGFYHLADKSGANYVGFIVFNRDTLELKLSLFDTSRLPDPLKKIDEIKSCLKSDVPPDLCYPLKVDDKNGKVTINSKCTYCQFFRKCYDLNKDFRAFQYSKTVEYITKDSVPDNIRVPEINALTLLPLDDNLPLEVEWKAGFTAKKSLKE